MTTERSIAYLQGLVRELCNLPKETEWVEFKENNDNPDDIGEYISALANAAALQGKAFAYLVWGGAQFRSLDRGNNLRSIGGQGWQ